MAPDSLFVRTLADDLEQVSTAPTSRRTSPPRSRARGPLDIIRRAYETVRFMNVAVMNGNDFKGRPALSLDSMPEEEAADTQRAIRPVMAPGTVDTFAIMTLHQQVLRGPAGRRGALVPAPAAPAGRGRRFHRPRPAQDAGADVRRRQQLSGADLAADRHHPQGRDGAARAEARTAAPSCERPDAEKPSAQISYEAKGNPISSRPVTSVANCCPGLEVDFRAVWRRLFKGIELREYDNLVIKVGKDCDKVVKRDRRQAEAEQARRASPAARRPAAG